jgi:hypothetical protein
MVLNPFVGIISFTLSGVIEYHNDRTEIKKIIIVHTTLIMLIFLATNNRENIFSIKKTIFKDNIILIIILDTILSSFIIGFNICSTNIGSHVIDIIINM